MFFVVKMHLNLLLKPEALGPSWQQELRSRLFQQVEGTCDGKTGYIIAITDILDYGSGMIKEEARGQVTFNVEFEAIVMKPVKNEVMDAVVTQVGKLGFFAEVGPLECFVSHHVRSLATKPLAAAVR